MAIETGLEGKPWYMAAGVGLLLTIAVVVALKYIKFNDMNGQIVRKERKLQTLEREINEGRAAMKSLPQFREEVGRLQLELDKLLRILPSRRNTEDLLRRIRRLTEQGNFDLLRFTPKALSQRDFYSEWPIQIQLNGQYHNLALFFDRIRRFSRIINVEDLRLNAMPGRSRHTISARFTIKTFIYNRPPEESG
ncbi:MAG: type 4a pilus biogenesis protein PilO [bacterium]|nr:type 4a pilus biogenesis protein PilO [bacterium]